jgi:hypothetical protein
MGKVRLRDFGGRLASDRVTVYLYYMHARDIRCFQLSALAWYSGLVVYEFYGERGALSLHWILFQPESTPFSGSLPPSPNHLSHHSTTALRLRSESDRDPGSDLKDPTQISLPLSPLPRSRSLSPFSTTRINSQAYVQVMWLRSSHANFRC